MLKKVFFIIMLLQVCSLFGHAQEIIHVKSHNETHLNWYGDFYHKTKFPSADSSFKKIVLKLTIGCPTNGCSDWDYTVKVFARRQTGLDTANQPIYEYIEFARYITPYAGDKNFGFYRTFETDVTDFRSVLTDSVDIGVKYEGYSDGFTISLDYDFYVGTPIREAYNVIPIYYGGFPYGDPNNSIENYLKPISFETDSTTEEVGVHILQTGHGFGGNEDCAEFCPKYNFIKINGQQRFSNLVWKDDCGKNPLFAQPGTWLYDRANWCPGEMVRPFYHDLSDFIIADSTNVFDMDMTPFTNIGNNNCSYNIAANLIFYRNRYSDTDLILEDILTPNKKWTYSRFNPICSKPKIKVKNNGKKDIEGIRILYGVQGTNDMSEIIWNNILPAYTSTEIELNTPVFNDSTLFYATIFLLDTTVSEYEMSNNSLVTSFELVKTFPPRFAIEFRANNAPHENYYEILDAAGNQIHYKDEFKANMMHRDTISFPPGCYTFILHDSDKDGLSFFANTDGLGSLRFRNMNGTYFQSFNADFGTEIRYQFMIDPTKVGMNFKSEIPAIKLYPNPSSSNLFIDNTSNEKIRCVKIFSILGKLQNTYHDFSNKENVEIKISDLANGQYIFEIETDKNIYREKIQIIGQK